MLLSICCRLNGAVKEMQDRIESGNFLFSPTSIEGVVVVDATCYGDERGYFMETYKRSDFEKAGITANFVQSNESCSSQGVLRGLHFQINHPQAKLVRVVSGEVFDVCVDLRPGSPTFGSWEGIVLSGDNHKQLFIPRGFAHGFYVLSERAQFCYKCDDEYHPDDEGGIRWDDPTIGIAWPLLPNVETVMSEKDRVHPSLADLRF